MELPEIRESNQIIKLENEKTSLICEIKDLKDRIAELEILRDELFKACERAIKYMAPTNRLNSGLVIMMAKIRKDQFGVVSNKDK